MQFLQFFLFFALALASFAFGVDRLLGWLMRKDILPTDDAAAGENISENAPVLSGTPDR